MKNKFRIGFIAEVDDSEEAPHRPVKFIDWKFFLDFFSKKGEIVLFDWKNVDKDFMISEYVVGKDGTLRVVRERKDIRDLCDIIYIGQLGDVSGRRKNFLEFLDIMEKFPGVVVNPVETIRENLSKQYLLNLQDKGISVIPTLEVCLDWDLNKLKNIKFPNYDIDFNDLVLKPKVFGEKGVGVIRLSEIKNDENLEKYLKINGETIVQPLIDDIYDKGENSFIFTGKKFSHGVNKVTGNFKINMCNSSVYTRKIPSEKEMKLCMEVLDSWPSNFGYVRIDIIPCENPLISEVEMVNPAGYLLEVDAFEIYSENLNDRLNDISRGKWI